jgi:hypothetical protein
MAMGDYCPRCRSTHDILRDCPPIVEPGVPVPGSISRDLLDAQAEIRRLNLQVGEMKKLLADIHEAGHGLFLQLDPRGGVGERLSIVWDRLAPYAANRQDEKLAPEIPFTQDELKALQDSPFKGPDTPWPEAGGNPWAPNKDYPSKPIS